MKLLHLRFSFISIIIISLLALSGCNNAGETKGQVKGGGDDVFTIKIGHIASPEDHYSIGINEYTKAVEEATDGRVQFEIFGNGELGGEADLAEQIQMGSLDMSVITTGVLGDFYEDLRVFDMPFLFRDLDHAYTVLDSDFAQDILNGMDEVGFKGIAFWENGLRHITNNKGPIYSPKDMEGLKIRTIENNMFIDTYKLLGADPVPMEFPEVYSSLQQGVIDGIDQPYSIMWGKKIYEVQKHLSEVGFYYASATLLMNDEFYESLPEEIQEVIVDLGKEYAVKEREIARNLDSEQKEKLIDEGLEVVPEDEVDIKAFKKAVEPFYNNLDDKNKKYVEKIRDM